MPETLAHSSLGSPPSGSDAGAKAAVVSKAVVRAAEALGLRQAELAAILGISPASTSRLIAGHYQLQPEGKPFEHALLLIRVFRSLSGILGEDGRAMQAWMRVENLALRGVPAQLVTTTTGLVETLAYLDAARARI